MSKGKISGSLVERRNGFAIAARTLTLASMTAILNFLPAVSARAVAFCPDMTTVRIQKWPEDILNLVPWVADAKGMFRKHCMDVKFVQIVGGPASSAAMVSGSLDFASSTADVVMRSRSKGVDFRLTSNMYAGQWSALLASNHLSLPHLAEGYPAIMKDLAGKKIGVTALGGSTEAFIRASFEGAGMDGSSATYVSVGGATTAIPALKLGVVDAAVMFGNGPDLGEALGAGKIVLDYRKKGVGPEVMQALWGSTLGWAAYGPYIEKHPAVVANFAAANNEAIAWIQNLQNRKELYELIGELMPLPDTVQDKEKTLERIVEVNAGGLGVGVPDASIEGWNKYLLSLKQIAAPIPYTELVWKTGRP